MTPHWLIPVIHSQSSIGISPTAPPTATPALLISRSTDDEPRGRLGVQRLHLVELRHVAPQRASRCRPARVTIARGLGEAAPRRCRRGSRRAPRAASSHAKARPRPEAAPVTTQEGLEGSMRRIVAERGPEWKSPPRPGGRRPTQQAPHMSFRRRTEHTRPEPEMAPPPKSPPPGRRAAPPLSDGEHPDRRAGVRPRGVRP